MLNFLQNKKLLSLLSSFLVVLFLQIFACNSVLADNMNEAKVFTERFANDIGEINAKPEWSEQKKYDTLVELIKERIDFDWVSRFALGFHWEDMNESQKQKYLVNYKKFLIQTYVPKFKKYTNENFKVLDVVDIEDGEYIVECKFKDPDTETIIEVQMFVRIYEYDGEKLFFDIVGEGISFIQMQRSEIDSAIATKGVDRFLDDLVDKVNGNKTVSARK